MRREAQARQAVELDPLGFTQNNLARILWFEGKNDEADEVARKVAELQPTAASSRRWQVLIAVQRGDGETALREAQSEPDPKVIAVSNWRWRNYVGGDRNGRGRSFERAHCNTGATRWPIKSQKFMQCAVKKTKHSSGCKSPTIITTPARWLFWSIRYCTAYVTILVTKRS